MCVFILNYNFKLIKFLYIQSNNIYDKLNIVTKKNTD